MELTEQQINELLDDGMSPEEIADLSDEQKEALYPKTRQMTLDDMNPLPAVGKGFKKANNLLSVPLGFVLSGSYRGDLSGVTESEGFKKYKQSLDQLQDGDFVESLKTYNQSLNEGLPLSGQYLNEEKSGVNQISPGAAFKTMYDLAGEGSPKIRKVLEFASDVVHDPMGALGSLDVSKAAKIKNIPINPDTAIGNLAEGIGKKVYKAPFLPVDTKLEQLGYNSFGDLAYEEGFKGSYGKINKQLKNYTKETTDNTKRALSMLSEQKMVGVEPEGLREPLLKALHESRDSAGLRPSPNQNRMVEDINMWTENFPRSQENNKIIEDYFAALAKYNKDKAAFQKNVNFISNPDGNLIPVKDADVEKIFTKPELSELSKEEMPLVKLNNRKSLANDHMRDKEFYDNYEYGASEPKENMRRIRDAIQKLEEDAVSAYSPVLGAEIKRDNKNLSTAIEARPFLERAEIRAVPDFNNPRGLYHWTINRGVVPALTVPPQVFKAARGAKYGGFVDTAIRRSLFDILGKLDDEEKLSPEK